VAVEDPGWANALDLVAALGMQPVPMSVDDEGPTPAGLTEALAAGAAAVIVTSRAQNPTGAAVSAARARPTPADSWPPARAVLLIEDDHAAELAEVPLAPLAGATRQWAFVRSVSKPYGPDLRLAVVAGTRATGGPGGGPDAARRRLGLDAACSGSWSSSGPTRRWRAGVDARRRSYAERRDALRDALNARGPRGTRSHRDQRVAAGAGRDRRGGLTAGRRLGGRAGRGAPAHLGARAAA
jgi:DNA-binding transcriptional MocR family regulator